MERTFSIGFQYSYIFLFFKKIRSYCGKKKKTVKFSILAFLDVHLKGVNYIHCLF